MPRSNGGPRTQPGKPALPARLRRGRAEGAIASRNALKHGITSVDPVIPGMEREADWRRHLDGILASTRPEGTLEEAFAHRLALLLWRLHRVTRYEVIATMRRIEATVFDLAVAANYLTEPLPEGEIHEPDPEEVRQEQRRRVFPSDDDLNRITRYEAHLHRQCLQTLHELEALQARRCGERPHLARLDISSPPLS